MSPTTLGSRAAARAVVATGAVVALTSGGFALASSAHLPSPPGPGLRPGHRVRGQDAEADRDHHDATETDRVHRGRGDRDAHGDDHRRPPRPPTSRASARPSRPPTAPTTARPSTAPPSPRSPPRPAAPTVAAYCVALIGEPKETGKPSELPTPTASPRRASRPTSPPASRPCCPTARPTSRPTSPVLASPPTSRTTPARVAGRTPQLPVPDRSGRVPRSQAQRARISHPPVRDHGSPQSRRARTPKTRRSGTVPPGPCRCSVSGTCHRVA